MGVFWGVSLLPVQLPPRGLPTPPLAWRRRCDLRFTDGRLQLHRMRQLRRFVLMSDQGPADAGMPGRLALPEGLEELVVHTQGIWWVRAGRGGGMHLWVRAGRGGGMHLWVPHQDLHPYLTRGRWAHQPGAASMSNLSQPGPCNTPPPPPPLIPARSLARPGARAGTRWMPGCQRTASPASTTSTSASSELPTPRSWTRAPPTRASTRWQAARCQPWRRAPPRSQAREREGGQPGLVLSPCSM